MRLLIKGDFTIEGLSIPHLGNNHFEWVEMEIVEISPVRLTQFKCKEKLEGKE